MHTWEYMCRWSRDGDSLHCSKRLMTLEPASVMLTLHFLYYHTNYLLSLFHYSLLLDLVGSLMETRFKWLIKLPFTEIQYFCLEGNRLIFAIPECWDCIFLLFLMNLSLVISNEVLDQRETWDFLNTFTTGNQVCLYL